MTSKRSFLKLAGLAVAMSLGLSANAVMAGDITGAGATFPYPIYAKWAEAYKNETGVGMNYQSIGSGGGIKQIKAKTVNFGASDMPLKPQDLAGAGLMQFPTVMGGDVPVYNIEGIGPGQIKFSGDVLANIYLGQIKKWNDPQLARLNPGLALPDSPITVVHRSDGSGTTFIWTNYLSKQSMPFKRDVGEGTSVQWPTGMGGKGNEGVAAFVKQVKGSIGYVEYAYALQNKMSYGLVKNKAGNFVKPDSETFKAAAAGAKWNEAPGFYLVLTDQPGKDSWPITGATFILMHRVQDNPESAKDVLKFFNWAYAKGDALADSLDYVPMPDSVVHMIQNAWKSEIKDQNGRPVY